jgi:hypothetical protein
MKSNTGLLNPFIEEEMVMTLSKLYDKAMYFLETRSANDIQGVSAATR